MAKYLSELEIGEWAEDENGHYHYVVESHLGIDGKVRIVTDGFERMPIEMLQHILNKRKEDEK